MCKKHCHLLLSLQKKNFFSLFAPQFFIQKFSEMLVWAVYTCKIFSIHKEMGNWDF